MSNEARALIFGMGLVLLVPAYVILQSSIGLLPIGDTAFLSIGLLGFGVALGLVLMRPARLDLTDAVWEHEATAQSPVFLTAQDGHILRRNDAAWQAEAAGDPSETVPSFLRSYVADARALVFRVQERLLTQSRVEDIWPTARYEIEVSAFSLPDDQVLWRFHIRNPTRSAINSNLVADFVISVGKSGSVLSSSEDFADLMGAKHKKISDILGADHKGNAGFARLQTRHRAQDCFWLSEPEGRARRDYSLFLKDEISTSAQDILATLPFAVMQLDPDGTVSRVNPALTRLFPEDDVVGRNISDLLSDTGRPNRNWLEKIGSGTTASKPALALMRAGQTERFVQITIARTAAGGPAGLLAFLIDASELKSLEAQFVQGQKMQAIGQLAGGVAHDFNNLLTAISGHCDLLLLRHSSSDPDYGDLDQIRQNSNRAASLVGQLLAFSRKQTLQSETLDLARVLSDHTHLLNRLVGEKVDLRLNHGLQMKSVRADKRQLEQVIMNLVVNARDAMNGEGEITISTAMRSYISPQTKGRATVPPGDYCVISVADTGCGIPADKHQRIFEPFFTSKKTGEGTGLGLSTVYGIVKQTGGFIFVESVMGVGTTFEILLPAEPEAPAKDRLKADPKSETRIETKVDGVVLLVEDEAPVRAFASRALRLKGFNVIEAASAEEALQILEDTSLLIDVFVTDVVMPGKDGPTWVTEALHKRPGTRVVFVSGYAENQGSDGFDSIPNSTFLPKPFSLAELTTTVARLH